MATKAELESKHIAELHALAAEAGVPGYRMLRREDLVERLLEGGPGGGEKPRREPRERPSRRRRERPEPEPAPKPPAPKPPEPEPEPEAEAKGEPAGELARPRRKRRRRFGRRRKGLQVHELLAPPPGRQTLVYGESREACATLLREIAAQLSETSDGPDPVALLVDPSPEELAEWKREAPEAEIVAAGRSRHAADALAQAARRAEEEHVILLVDSLTRLEDAGMAGEIFDSASTGERGSLTVVAALERSS